jgi:hypothetical protein
MKRRCLGRDRTTYTLHEELDKLPTHLTYSVSHWDEVQSFWFFGNGELGTAPKGEWGIGGA